MFAALVRHCDLRIAEDDTTNAAEAIDANLCESVRLFSPIVFSMLEALTLIVILVVEKLS
jgi:hypothetical protein